MGKLADAARIAFADWPARFGIHLVTGVDTPRSEVVRLVGERVTVAIGCDWLEGEMSVTVQLPGHPAMPWSEVVDLEAARGLATTRLSKGISRSMVESRLVKIAELLESQAEPMLRGRTRE